MIPTKTFSGWLTRESSGHVYFHTQKPYCVKNTREDSRDNKAIVTHQWFTGGSGEAFSLDYDSGGFDYAANDTDSKGEPAGYRIALAQVKSDEKQLAISKRDLKNAKDKIELAHPRMAPVNPKWTMKYYQKET